MSQVAACSGQQKADPKMPCDEIPHLHLWRLSDWGDDKFVCPALHFCLGKEK